MATSAAAAAASSCALIGSFSSAPRLPLLSTRPPNQSTPFFPSSREARNRRSLVVGSDASAAPGNTQQDTNSQFSYRLIVPVPLSKETDEVMSRGSRPSSVLDQWESWDIAEGKEEVQMRFDMPGLSNDEVEVLVKNNNELVIKVEPKKDAKGTAGNEKDRSSRSYSLLLPNYCDKKNMQWEVKNGVLRVTIQLNKKSLSS